MPSFDCTVVLSALQHAHTHEQSLPQTFILSSSLTVFSLLFLFHLSYFSLSNLTHSSQLILLPPSLHPSSTKCPCHSNSLKRSRSSSLALSLTFQGIGEPFDHSLTFDSDFESGNLLRAIQRGKSSYDLFLRSGTYPSYNSLIVVSSDFISSPFSLSYAVL